jgi:hypothetical protein
MDVVRIMDVEPVVGFRNEDHGDRQQPAEKHAPQRDRRTSSSRS